MGGEAVERRRWDWGGWLRAECGTFQAEATSTKGCFYLVNSKGAWEIFAWKPCFSNEA